MPSALIAEDHLVFFTYAQRDSAQPIKALRLAASSESYRSARSARLGVLSKRVLSNSLSTPLTRFFLSSADRMLCLERGVQAQLPIDE